MTCLHEVLRVHEQKLRLACRLESSRDDKVLRLFLKHESCVLEHCRVHLMVYADYIDAVNHLCYLSERMLESYGLLLDDLFHLLLQFLVLAHHFLYGSSKVRGIVEECLCNAQAVFHAVNYHLCMKSGGCLYAAHAGCYGRL